MPCVTLSTISRAGSGFGSAKGRVPERTTRTRRRFKPAPPRSGPRLRPPAVARRAGARSTPRQPRSPATPPEARASRPAKRRRPRARVPSAVARARAATGARQPASSAGEEGPLGLHLGARRGMIQAGERSEGRGVGGAGDDGQRSLAGGRKEHGLLEHLGDPVQPIEPRQPRPGQNDRVQASLLEAADPRIDVAARLTDLEVRPGRREAAPAAGGSSPIPGSRGKVGEPLAGPGDQDVARVLPFRNRREGEALRDDGRHVLADCGPRGRCAPRGGLRRALW